VIVVVVCAAAAAATLPEFFECRVQPATSSSTNATRLTCVPTALGRSAGYSLGRSAGYSLGYRYANQALFTFIPLVLLAVFNSLLIHAVLTAARRRKVMVKTGSQCVTHRPSAAAAAAGDVVSSHDRQRSGQQRITVLLSLSFFLSFSLSLLFTVPRISKNKCVSNTHPPYSCRIVA